MDWMDEWMFVVGCCKRKFKKILLIQYEKYKYLLKIISLYIYSISRYVYFTMILSLYLCYICIYNKTEYLCICFWTQIVSHNCVCMIIRLYLYLLLLVLFHYLFLLFNILYIYIHSLYLASHSVYRHHYILTFIRLLYS